LANPLLTKLGQKSSASFMLADGLRANAALTQSYFLTAAGAGLPATAEKTGFTRPPEEMYPSTSFEKVAKLRAIVLLRA
jgi:hypothetical protein